MNILEIIADTPEEGKSWKRRTTVRAVLFDDEGLVPIIFLRKLGYHKLPGGGVLPDEQMLDALEREVLEEVGSTIKIGGEIGSVVERRGKNELIQTSTCYTGRIVSRGKPNLTKRERRAMAETHWMDLGEAIATLASEHPRSYEGGFINRRELVYLRHVRGL